MAKLMNWPYFSQKLDQKKIKIFSPFDLKRLFGVSETSIRFFLHRYTKKGYIKKLKRGLYCLSNQPPNDYYLANKLYEPSYISFEQALSYYHIIPETVYTITSATSKATREFECLGKSFYYHRVKKSLFFGYKQKIFSNQIILMARAEKAFVDYLYFVSLKKKKMLDRFDKNKINKDKVMKLARVYKNKKIKELIIKYL
ncbi:MAG: type IV toxin-antitoxin system AbiEi family antitoxin domain-containing protein [Patescibacteria group bacterium]|nr:type IV toxin-antitoxin system AbiEi family antitoxin domain-containing protein [Patescibacteria group bacterium]